MIKKILIAALLIPFYANASSTKTLYGAQIKNSSATVAMPSGSVTVTIPSATDTLAGKATADVFTNKDYDGGTASNTSRLTVPKAATATLSGLTRKQGTLLYDTTLNALFFDNGSAITQLLAASTSYFYNGYHDDTCSWSTTSTSFATPAIDSSCALTEIKRSGFSAISSYNNGTPGNNYPGITFTADGTSGYEVCALVNLTNSGTSYCEVQLYNGTAGISEANVQIPGSAAQVTVCGIVQPSSGSVNMSLKIATSSGAVTCTITKTAGALTHSVDWILKKL